MMQDTLKSDSQSLNVKPLPVYIQKRNLKQNTMKDVSNKLIKSGDGERKKNYIITDCKNHEYKEIGSNLNES